MADVIAEPELDPTATYAVDPTRARRLTSRVVAGPAAGLAALEEGLDQLMEHVRTHVGGNLTDDVAVLLIELPHTSSVPVDSSV